MANTYSAGIVTAYGAAVRGGYTGTYEEFCAQQAAFAESAEQVSEDRAAVEQIKTTFENQTVPAAVQQVNQAGAAQVQDVQDAGAAEERDIASAGAAQETRVLQAGTDQVAAVNAAGSTQVQAIQTAGAAQVTAVQDAGFAQVQAVQTAGAAQVGAVEDKGEEVLASIPQDYSALTGEVEGLKSVIQDSATAESLGELSVDILQGYWAISTGDFYNDTGTYLGTNKFYIAPGSTIEASNVTGESYAIFWDINDQYISGVSFSLPLTVPSNCAFCAIDFRASLGLTNVSLSVSTATSRAIANLEDIASGVTEKIESRNLYNGEYVPGYYSQGAIIQSDTYCRTKPISMSAGKYLFSSTKSEFGAVSGQRVYVLNAVGGIAQMIDATVIGAVTESPVYNNRDVCAFELAADCVISLNVGRISDATQTKAQVSNFMLVAGETLADFGQYEPYHAPEYVLKETLDLTETMQDSVNGLSGLIGKEAVFEGDSICHGTSVGTSDPTYGYGWAGRIGIANAMNWTNYGINGGAITSRGNSKITASHSVVDNIDTVYAQHPDAEFIIFEGGTNDADLLGDASTSADFGTFSADDFSGSYDINTFTGALETIFYKAINYWKGKKIGFIIAQKMGRYMSARTNRHAYFVRAMEVCEKWGIPYINLWDNCYLNPINPLCWDSSLTVDGNIAAGNLYTDAQHLTAKGYDYISPMIENWMKSL